MSLVTSFSSKCRYYYYKRFVFKTGEVDILFLMLTEAEKYAEIFYVAFGSKFVVQLLPLQIA